VVKFSYLGAGDAHGDPDVCPLQRRGVVHAVTGHRHDVPLPLEHVHQPDLVLGRHPGDHPDIANLVQGLVVAHGAELGPGDGLAVDAELAGDSGRGDRVVTSDHPDLDACGPGRGDRCPGGGAGRVDDPDQGEQFRVGHEREQVGAGVEGGGVEVLARGGHHPQALLPQPLVLSQVQLAEFAVGRYRASVGVEDRRGAGEQLVGGALDEAADHFVSGLVFHPVERGHQLVGGVERELGDPRIRLPGGDGVYAALGRQRDQFSAPKPETMTARAITLPAQVPPNIVLAASENGALADASLEVGTMPNTAVSESM
jgi:hypothetical protein